MPRIPCFSAVETSRPMITNKLSSKPCGFATATYHEVSFSLIDGDVANTKPALHVLLHAEHHGFSFLSADCPENRAIRRRNVKPTFSGYTRKLAAQYPMHSEVKFLQLHEIFSLSSRNQISWTTKSTKQYSSKLQFANVAVAKH